MFYAGVTDATLRRSVKDLARARRSVWVEAFNTEYERGRDEGAAHRAAWAAVRGKKMEPKTKAINLTDLRNEVARRLDEAFPGTYSHEIFDEFVIAVATGEDNAEDLTADAPDFWKIGYVTTWQTIAGDPNEMQVVESIAFAPRQEWVRMLPTFVAVKAFAQPDGQNRWLMISSGCFEDRDGEVVSTEFLESALSIADKANLRGTLDVWHIPGSDIGTCDYQALVNGFLLESGLFDQSPAGQHAAQHLKEHATEYGGSIQFYYKNRTADGVYQAPGVIVRRSVLPRDKAAFPWSAVALKELSDMAVKISPEKQAELAKIVGDDEAGRILDNLDAGSEALKDAGVRFKEVVEAEAPDNGVIGGSEPVAEIPPVAEIIEEKAADTVEPAAVAPVPQEFEALLSKETLDGLVAQVVKELADAQKAVNTGTLERLDNLTAALQKISQDVDALKASDSERMAAMVKETPRATLRAIVRPSQSAAALTAKSEGAPAPATDLAKVAAATLYGAQ